MDISKEIVLDPKKELNKVLFDNNNKLKNDILEQLNNIAEEFIDFSNLDTYKVKIKDIVLTGSNVNYNYNDKSDIDIHIIVEKDFKNDIEKELFEDFFNVKRNLWNNKYDITVKGISVECYIQLNDEEHYATSVYSIKNNNFVEIPEKKTNVKVDKDKIKEIYYKFKKLIQSSNCDTHEKVMDKLKEMRKKGLNKNEFEFSTENLAFKLLRNTGLLDKLNDNKKKCLEDKLSLKEGTKVKHILDKYIDIVKEKVGYLGKLNTSDLLDYNDFSNELDIILDDDDDAIISNFESFKIYKIWENYKNAMERKRKGLYLDFFGFCNYMQYAYLYQYDSDNYIIGQYENGFFKPSHFSPSTIRKGLEMIQDICKYNNIIFAVTDDLKNMLNKVGTYTDNKLVIPMFFRGMLVQKHIIVTHPKVLNKILKTIDYNNLNALLNITHKDIFGDLEPIKTKYKDFSDYEEYMTKNKRYKYN